MKKTKRTSTKPQPASAPSMPRAQSTAEPLHTSGEVEVTTTVRTKGGKNVGSSVLVHPTTSNRAQASLNLFKDLKKIQTSLRKDDITWDC